MNKKMFINLLNFQEPIYPIIRHLVNNFITPSQSNPLQVTNQMKYINYDANEHNVDRMVQVERQKINHIKMLNTIYKKKSYSILKEQREINRDRSLRINNQLIDKERKWRETQRQINHENTILRNKLLNIYIPKDKDFVNNETMKTNQSLDTIYKDKTFGLNFPPRQQNSQSRTKISTHLSNSPSVLRKLQAEKELSQTNAKFFTRLSNIQSDLMPRLKLNQHSKEAAYLKEMLRKRSPNKNLRMKKFVQRTISERQRALPASSSLRQYTKDTRDSINPQEMFVFY